MLAIHEEEWSRCWMCAGLLGWLTGPLAQLSMFRKDAFPGMRSRRSHPDPSRTGRRAVPAITFAEPGCSASGEAPVRRLRPRFSQGALGRWDEDGKAATCVNKEDRPSNGRLPCPRTRHVCFFSHAMCHERVAWMPPRPAVPCHFSRMARCLLIACETSALSTLLSTWRASF